jgi:5-formyltetrahydrofolate cyclo-ligase
LAQGGQEAGFTALLPVVIDEHRALAFRAWSPGTVMVSDRYGIPAPAAGDFLIPEVVLIPVNGFDAAGYRIGYGGGYFDRTLASLPSSARRRRRLRTGTTGLDLP